MTRWQCSVCGGWFDEDSATAEEREAEYRAQFPDYEDDQREDCCTECYGRVIEWGLAHGLVQGGKA